MFWTISNLLGCKEKDYLKFSRLLKEATKMPLTKTLKAADVKSYSGGMWGNLNPVGRLLEEMSRVDINECVQDIGGG